MNYSDIDIAELLLKHGANPYIAKYDWNNPIYITASKGYKRIVEMMPKYKN